MNRSSDPVTVGGPVRHALLFAREALNEDTTGAPTLTDMARAAGVSPRTLQRHFARVLSSTPHKVLLRWRLEGARRTLAAKRLNSVTAVALQHGFEHPGRFSVAYRQAFGESPSTTLRRAHTPAGPSAPRLLPSITLRPLTSSVLQDARRLRHLTDDLAIAMTRSRELELADDRRAGPSCSRMLLLDGHLDDDALVLRLRNLAQSRVIWMKRQLLGSEQGSGWANHAVCEIIAALAAEGLEQARRTPLRHADPETLYVRAKPAAMALDPDSVGVALDLLNELNFRDPTHARGQALAGWCLAQGANHSFSLRDPEAERQSALDHARGALELAPDDPEVLTFAAGVMSLTRNLGEAETLIERSLALDPHQPEAWRRRDSPLPERDSRLTRASHLT